MDSAQINPVGAAAMDGRVASPSPARPRARPSGDAGRDAAVRQSWREAAALAAELVGVQAATQCVAGRVTFDVDADSGKIIVRVVDPETNAVLREIPPEEMRRFQKVDLRGMHVDRSA